MVAKMSRFRALLFPVANANAGKNRAGCHGVHFIALGRSAERLHSKLPAPGSEVFSPRHYKAPATTSWRQSETGPAFHLLSYASVGGTKRDEEDPQFDTNTALHTAWNVNQNRHCHCLDNVEICHSPHPHLFHPLATTRKNAALWSRSIIFQKYFSSSGPEAPSLQPLHHTASDTKAKRSPPSLLDDDAHSKRAVKYALICNALVLSMKLGVYFTTRSSVMLAEAVHSLADLCNQGLLAYGLASSKRAPDASHPYGYTKERFVWALISATGIFCLGSGLTIMHGVQCLWHPEEVQNVYVAGGVIFASAILEGGSLYVALRAVAAGARNEGMTFRHYLWRGHDPTAVAVMMEDGAAVTGLGIAAASMAAVHYTHNPIYDALGSIAVGGLMGVVAVVLIGRNRESLLGRSMDAADMHLVMTFLKNDPVVDAVWDCKSEVIGPSAYRFKAEIDFNGNAIVKNYLERVGRKVLYNNVRGAVNTGREGDLDVVMENYGEELMTALGAEIDRLEKEITKLVPEIRHLDIEAHNPMGPPPIERIYLESNHIGRKDSLALHWSNGNGIG